MVLSNRRPEAKGACDQLQRSDQHMAAAVQGDPD